MPHCGERQSFCFSKTMGAVIRSAPLRLTLSSIRLREYSAGYPRIGSQFALGALAQLGERLICIQEVRSSILLGSTITLWASQSDR